METFEYYFKIVILLIIVPYIIVFVNEHPYDMYIKICTTLALCPHIWTVLKAHNCTYIVFI